MMVLAGLFVIFVGALNRARGGGFGASALPGHPRLWVSTLLGLAVAALIDPSTGAAVAASYLMWAWLPWGRWFDLGRSPKDPARSPSAFERAIEELFPGDHIRFTVRNLIALMPAAILLGWWFLLIAPAQTLAYEAGWRVRPANPIGPAEIATGMLWGCALLLLF